MSSCMCSTGRHWAEVESVPFKGGAKRRGTSAVTSRRQRCRISAVSRPGNVHGHLSESSTVSAAPHQSCYKTQRSTTSTVYYLSGLAQPWTQRSSTSRDGSSADSAHIQSRNDLWSVRGRSSPFGSRVSPRSFAWAKSLTGLQELPGSRVPASRPWRIH